MKKIAAFIFGSVFVATASAANWYAFTGNSTNNAYYFFDKDTIVKRPGGITIWIKSVYDVNKNQTDGGYAYANKYSYDCKKRLAQNLTLVKYGKNREHIATYSQASPPAEVVPGSVGEGLLTSVCAPDFPNDKSNDYVKIKDNDIYSLAQYLFDTSNDPAPK